jgi:LysM repeat protein
MSKPYIVRKGDTLAKIAEATLGDRKLAAALADYNGLAGVRDIAVGQAIHLPGARALRAPKRPPAGARAAVAPWPPAPHGMAAIIATFGDIRAYARDDGTADPKWEQQFMARAALPFSIPLDWDTSKSASGIRCHKLIAPLLQAVFTEIVQRGLQKSVKTYGGGYTWRMKRGQAKPSTHSWGIAIDLNARTNAMGTAGDMDPALVALFEGHGFIWGGRWSGSNKDPMHFQYCSGY